MLISVYEEFKFIFLFINSKSFIQKIKIKSNFTKTKTKKRKGEKMYYFSYNDYADCMENEEIEKILKVEEEIEKYEAKNGVYKKCNQNNIIKELKEKKNLIKFLNNKFNIDYINIDDLYYYNLEENIFNKDNSNIILSKITNKEMFILIKVIDKVDNNIPYKIFENCIKVIELWEKNEKQKNKRYPIVIPIVIYVGNEEWNIDNKLSKKFNYTTFKDNIINFSFNFIKIKNKYLQID